MDLVSRNFLQKAPSLSFAMPGDSSSPTLTQLDHVILVESPSRRAVGGYTWQYTTENLPCSICAGQSRKGCRLPGNSCAEYNWLKAESRSRFRPSALTPVWGVSECKTLRSQCNCNQPQFAHH